MGKLFGTDGVRGIANLDLMPEDAMNIGRAGAFVLAGQLKKNKPRILIGSDTRISADMLAAALVAGLCSVGAEAYVAGVLPSPAMAHLVRQYKMDAGVMLSASHNPMPDNGIKFFDGKGYKLSDEMEDKIETLLVKDEGKAIPRPVGEQIGRRHDCKAAVADYVDFLVETLQGNSLTGMKVALDCANGACHEAAIEAFRRMDAEIFPLHYKPDGTNINLDCGSTHLDSLAAFVKARPDIDLGLAFDGDGDRVLCVDERGEIMDGDAIMAVCGLALKRKGKLANDTIVATVMSNLGLQNFCDQHKISLLRADVGDRYVIQKMQEGKHQLGGEQSGHIIFHEHNTTGDGILTGLQLAAIIKESGQKMSELRKVFEALPQVLLGVKLKSRLEGDLRQNKKIDQAIRKTEELLANEGRVLIRPSGTEPLVRVMLEGRTLTQIQDLARKLANLIESELS